MTRVRYLLVSGLVGVGALVLNGGAFADNCCQSSWSTTATLNTGAKNCLLTVGGGTANGWEEYAGPPTFMRDIAAMSDTTGAYSPGIQARCRTSSSGSWTNSGWVGPTQQITTSCAKLTTSQFQCRTELADNTFCASTCSPP